MATIKTKKSAFEEALDSVKSGAYNFASNVGKTVSPVVNQASNTANNFYQNFSKGVQNYANQQNQSAYQKQAIAANFAKNVIGAAKNIGQGMGQNFANNVKAVSQVPQAVSESAKLLPTALSKAKATATTGLGVGLGATANLIKSAPTKGSSGIVALDLINQATGQKLYDMETLGERYPKMVLPGEKFGAGLRQLGSQDSRQADIEAGRVVPELNENRSITEKINDPRWVLRGLTMNAPSFMASLGLAGLTAVVIKNPAAASAILFGSSSLQNAGDVYNDAIQYGADEELATNLSAATGLVMGILDTIGIGKLLQRIPGGDVVKDSIAKYLLRNVIESSLSEGATESVQQMVQNAAAKAYYDHKRDILANVPESGFFSALMGGVSSAGTDAFNISTGRTETGEALGAQAPEEPITGEQQREPEQFGVPTSEPQFRTGTSSPAALYNVPMEVNDMNIADDAIKYLESVKDIEDYMSPRYSNSENAIRDLAARYINRQFGVKAPINEVLQEVKNRFEIDKGDIIEKGLANNIGNKIQATLPETTDQAIKADMDKMFANEGVEQITPNVGNQVVEKEEFRTTPMGNEFDMTREEAQGVIRGLFSPEEVEFMTMGTKDIVTPDGQFAHGKYYDSIISVIEDQGKVESKTVYHEAFHAYANKFVEPQLYNDAIEETKLAKKISEQEAVEDLAEGFADFVAGRQTFGGKILEFFNQLLSGVRRMMGLEDSANMIYRNILEGKRPSQGQTQNGASFRQVNQNEVSPIGQIGPVQDVGVGVKSNEELLDNINMIRQQRGEGPLPPETQPKQIGEELTRTAKIEINRLNTMKEDLQGQISDAERMLNNYDLYKKVYGKSLATKADIKSSISDLKESIKQIDKQVSEFEKNTKPIFEQIKQETDDEIALRSVQEYQKNTSLVPKEEEVPVTPQTQATGPAATTISIGSTISEPSRGTTGAQTETREKRGFVEQVEQDQTVPNDIRSKIGTLDDAYYNVITNKETLAKAQEKVINNESGEISELLDPDRRWTLEESTVKNATALVLARKAIADGNNQLADDIIMSAAKKGTLGGQFIQSFSMWSKLSPEGMLRFANKEVEAYNQKRVIGEPVAIDPETRDQIISRMKEVQKMQDGPAKQQALAEVLSLIADKLPPTVSELFDSYRYTNLLSNPLTHLRNTYGNLTQVLGVKPLTKGAEVVVDLIGSTLFGKERQTYASEVPAYYKGVLNAVPVGIQAFMDAITGKTDIQNPDLKASEILYSARQKNMPKALVMIPRLLEASDKFFTALVEQGEYAAQREKGVDIETAKEIAQREAQRYLYRNDIDPDNKTGQGNVLSGIDKMTKVVYELRKIPGLSWLIPFIKTPMNVAKAQIEYSPLGVTTAIGAKNPRAQLAKSLLGTSVMAIGATMALAGKTTWAAPSDKKEKELFYASGRRPFSILLPTPLGEKWVPMEYFGVFALALAIPAAVKFAEQDSKTALTDSQIEKMGKVAAALGNYYVSKTYMQGIGNFVRMAEGDVDFLTGPNLAFTAGQILPLNGLISYTSRVLDPVYRKASSFEEGFIRNLPGLSQSLEAYQTPAGDESKRPLSASVLPYGLGTPDGSYEDLYKVRQGQLQNNAVVNKLKADVEAGKVSTGIGGKATGMGGLSEKATYDNIKKNVDDLMELYFTTSDENMRSTIEKSVESYGVSFGSAAQDYLMKDIAITQKGLGPTAQKKLERTNEFEYIRRLRDNYSKLGVADQFLANEYNKHKITEEDLVYDDKTLLPDDVQLDQIKQEVDGLKGDQYLAKLMSMRVISEGSRKPLLTDTIVGKLEDEGMVNEATADLLKSVTWDTETQTFKKVPGSGKKLKKSDYDLTFTPAKAKVAEMPKLGQGISTKSFSLPKLSGSNRVSLKVPKTQFAPMNIGPRVSPSIRTPVRNISGLGRP